MDVPLAIQKCLDVGDRLADGFTMSRICDHIERRLQTLREAFGGLTGGRPTNVHLWKALMMDLDRVCAAGLAGILHDNDVSRVGIHALLLANEGEIPDCS
jgi:hypothetical protein